MYLCVQHMLGHFSLRGRVCMSMAVYPSLSALTPSLSVLRKKRPTIEAKETYYRGKRDLTPSLSLLTPSLSVLTWERERERERESFIRNVPAVLGILPLSWDLSIFISTDFWEFLPGRVHEPLWRFFFYVWHLSMCNVSMCTTKMLGPFSLPWVCAYKRLPTYV